MRFLKLTVIFSLLTLASLQGQEEMKEKDYDLLPPDEVVYTDLRQSFTVYATHIIDFGPLKKHPKIIWLDQSSNRSREGQIANEIGFIVRSPGTVKFPPIPAVIESKSILLRLDPIRAIKNPASRDHARFDAFWNDQPEVPKIVHLGEVLEINFQGRIATEGRRDIFFHPLPTSRAENARWHLFTRQRGQNAYADDYFYGIPSRFSFRPQRYESGDTEIDGKHARYRSYKSRLICTKLGTVSGHLGMTLGRGQNIRTYLIPFKFEVLPLPPLPNDRVINTGLVGNWKLIPLQAPSRIQTNKSFKIGLRLQGKGDPNRRNEFDFSRNGFPSVERELPNQNRNSYPDNYLTWSGTFIQTIVPTGKVATFSPLTLAAFNTFTDEWDLHSLTPSLTLKGAVDITKSLTPSTTLGKSIQRPVLLNFPPATFGAFALAPFLPFLLGFLKKRLDQRDPNRQERRRKAKAFISENGDINDELLPLLRDHLNLPSGASTGEIAEALSAKGHDDLAIILKEHAQSSFSSSGSAVNFKALSQALAKVAFLFLLILPLDGATLESANLSYQESRYSDAITDYQALIEEKPGQPVLHRNLALAFLAVDDAPRARAACHTALLLDPLNSESRTLMNDIRTRLGAQTLPGTRFLELRPDQWFILSALIWVLGFFLIGLRHFQPRIPAWAAWAVITLAILFIGAGVWRNKTAYTSEQFMVLGKEVPREPKIGNPDWNFQPLRSGQIVNVSDATKTHAQITTTGTTFWIPLNQLQQVW